MLIQSVVVLKKRNPTYKSNNTVRRTGINVGNLASNMHNIENLIQPNYIRTVKTVSNNNIFQMEVKNIKYHCTLNALFTQSRQKLGLGVKNQICIQLQSLWLGTKKWQNLLVTLH